MFKRSPASGARALGAGDFPLVAGKKGRREDASGGRCVTFALRKLRESRGSGLFFFTEEGVDEALGVEGFDVLGGFA